MTFRRLVMLFAFVLLNVQLAGQNMAELELEIEKALILKDTTSLAQAWYNLAKYFDSNRETDKSNNALQQAIHWAALNKNYKTSLSAANYYASNLSLEGQSDSAIYYYNYAIEAGIKNSDSIRVASVLINLADEYASSGNYIEAANHAIMAVRIKETMKDSTNLAYFYQKVGEVYKQAGETEKWESYINKGYRLINFEKCVSTSAIAAIYNDLGGIAEKRGNYDQALLYYDTLVTIGKQNEYNNAIGVALSNSATIYKLKGELLKAIDAAKEASKYKTNTAYQQLYDNNLLAELILANGDPAEALKYADKSVSDINADNFPEEKMRALKLMYLIEKENRHFENALLWNEKYQSLYDSIRNKDIRTKILDLELAYETEKKENQIELLTSENQLKNQRIKTGVILLIVLVLTILLILYTLRIRRKQALLIQNDLQQQVLRSQMNPHFIFNVLGSIQNFMLSNDNKKAAKYLSQFASLTRATLEYSASDSISLANEMNMLSNYMELEKMRNPGKFDFNIIADENMETEFILIPPMIIQPFIENAIKHGFSDIDYPGMLILKISDKNNWIEFIIEDNGKGMSDENPENKHRSMAMQIFEKRRKLIQQKYKKDFKFEIKNLNDTDALKSGVRICINVPVLDYD